MLFWPYRLADGTQIVLRPIRADDKRRLSTAFARLSPESARLRFLAPKPRLTSNELRYLTEVDGDDHVALVAVRAHQPGLIVGVARFVRDRDDPHTAEVAIVIGDPWQGQGLGRHMGSALAAVAREHGIRRFTAVMEPDNRAAHRLLAWVQAELSASALAAQISRIAGYRVTFRLGPKVEHEKFGELDEALIAVEAKLRSIGTPHRETHSFLGRDFAPGQQVALRAELKGPKGLRAGIDLRGDGSTEAWTGRLGRRVVDLQAGEDVYAALRRVSWPA